MSRPRSDGDRWDSLSPSYWLADMMHEDSFLVDPEAGQTSTTLLFILPATATGEQHSGEEERDVDMNTVFPQPDDDPDRREAEDLDADFFDDLPVGARMLESKMPATLALPQPTNNSGSYAYNTYAYSGCMTLDDAGRAVASTRRRYEDSAGVLKAVHRRQVGTHVMESTWLKLGGKDEGKHSKAVNTGDITAFEREWMATPFGIAEKTAREHGEAKQTELPDAPPAQEIP